jgi:YVTN family beta-propeller protein
VAINPDIEPPIIYVTSSENLVYIIGGNINKTDRIINTVKIGTDPSGVAYNRHNFNVYVANSGSNDISVVDGSGRTDHVINTINLDSSPSGIAYNPHDKFMYVSKMGVVSVINGNTNSVIDDIKTAAIDPSSVACTYSGKVYIANEKSNEVIVMDIPRSDRPSSIKVGNNPYNLALDQLDNTKLYVSNISSNDVSIIDPNKDDVINTIRVDSLYSVACSRSL